MRKIASIIRLSLLFFLSATIGFAAPVNIGSRFRVSGNDTVTDYPFKVNATTLTATGGGSLTGIWSNLGTILVAVIKGGTIDGTPIGSTKPSTGTFTNLTVTGTTTLSGGFSGTASSATQLAADPADCAAGNFAQSIDSEGDLTCSTAVTSVATGRGLTGGPVTGSGTLLMSYSDTVAANPAFNAEECVFTTDGAGGGGFLCEGTASNSNEQLHLFASNDGADTTDFIVERATTDTLLNKTIEAANNYVEADEVVCTDCIGPEQMVPIDISTDTTLAVSGTLLALTGDTLSVREGTLTDEKVCTYESTGTLLDCNETETGSGSIVRATAPTFSTSITSPIVVSADANPADSGAVRLGNAESIAWEASPAGTDITLTVDSSEIMQVDSTLNATTLTESANAVPNSTNDLSFFSSTTSLQLLGVISDETGSGQLTFATAPTFLTSITTPTTISADADPADAGVLRLGNTETIAWEASPAGTDETIGLTTGESFTFSGPVEIDASDPADAEAIRLDNGEGIAWEASPTGTDVTLKADSSEIIQASTSLQAETSFISPVFTTNAADPADAGVLRLANAELIEWEASPAGTDESLSVDANENFLMTGPLELDASDAADAGALRLDNNEAIAWEASPAGTDVTLLVDASEILTVNNDFRITGDDLYMNTNTSGAVLVADGTNYNPVVVGGDVSIGTDGTATVADNSVDGTDIALGSDAQGDVMYYDGTNWVRLGAGTSGNFLKTGGASANPSWATPDGPDGARGLDITGPSAGVVTIRCNGATCSSTNPAYIRMNSTTGGAKVTLKMTTDATFTDDSGASDFGNLGFGITEAAHWANDVPFFLYACNKANTDFDGADGSSVLVLARNPAMSTTPAAANDIGDTGAIPTNDSEHVVLILDDVTVANYTSLPCLKIGALRMQWSTTTDDWTVQALGATDGIGREAIEATHAQQWTMPLGQNGASASTFMHPNGGTAPVFTTNQYYYTLRPDGSVMTDIFLDGDGGTDGAGAVQVRLSLPTRNWRRAAANGTYSSMGVATGATTITGGPHIIAGFTHNTQYARVFYQSASTSTDNVTNAMFSAGARDFSAAFIYRGFDTTP